MNREPQDPRDAPPSERELRERAFWDGHVLDIEESLSELRAGPDAVTRAMLDAVEPLEGRRVLDFACGAGVTSAWLAERGAQVTGLDLSPGSTAGADTLCRAAGVDVDFVAGPIESQP